MRCSLGLRDRPRAKRRGLFVGMLRSWVVVVSSRAAWRVWLRLRKPSVSQSGSFGSFAARMPLTGWRLVRLLGQRLLEGLKFVDVIGVSRGRGFTGVMRRHNFRWSCLQVMVPSEFIVVGGSIGQSADPSRVLAGTKWPGIMVVCVSRPEI